MILIKGVYRVFLEAKITMRKIYKKKPQNNGSENKYKKEKNEHKELINVKEVKRC